MVTRSYSHIGILKAMLLLGANASGQSEPTLLEHWWRVMPEVYHSVADPNTNTLYVSHSGLAIWLPPGNTGNGVLLDHDEGWPGTDHDSPNGAVNAVIPDGNGGWFIAGPFTQVGSHPRAGLARLNPDGSINTDWDPLNEAGVAGGDIHDLLLHDNVLYAAGNFTTAGGALRQRLAAFQLATGQLTPWCQGFNATNGDVRSLSLGDGVLYAGGSFTNIGGQGRQRLAALDLTTGAALPWNPSVPSDFVFKVEYADGVVYVGGSFTSINGQTRNRIGAIDGISGNLLAWNPGANNTVLDITVSGDTVLVGGRFTNIGGDFRPLLAMLDRNTDSNNILPWSTVLNTSPMSFVKKIVVTPTTIYAAGSFPTLGTFNQPNLIEVGRQSGLPTTWSPHSSNGDIVNSVAVGPLGVYVGGSFPWMGERQRSGVTAIDLNSGRPLPWQIELGGPDESVREVHIKGDTLIMIGSFTSVNGVPRQFAAALDLSTGTVLDLQLVFAGNIGNYVGLSTGCIVENRLFIAGNFTSINGFPRAHLAAINLSTGGVVMSWQSDVTGGIIPPIAKLAQDDGALFLAGSFTAVNGQQRQHVASIDPLSGITLSWTPAPIAGWQEDIGFTSGHIWIRDSNLQLRPLDKVTGGEIAGWSCNCPASGSVITTGGQFVYTQYQDGSLSAVQIATGATTSWQPDYGGFGNGRINHLLRHEDLLIVGGVYSTVNGESRHALSAWHVPVSFEDVSTDTEWIQMTDELFVSPNPSPGRFELRVEGPHRLVGGQLLDALGREVALKQPLQAGASVQQVEVDGQAKGVYLLRLVFADGGVRVARLVVE